MDTGQAEKATYRGTSYRSAQNHSNNGNSYDKSTSKQDRTGTGTQTLFHFIQELLYEIY